MCVHPKLTPKWAHFNTHTHCCLCGHMDCVYLCEYEKDTHTHTRRIYEAVLLVIYRYYSALFTVHNCGLLALFSTAGAEPLTVLSKSVCVWVCVFVCACMHCTNPASSNKTHLPINPGWFNMSPYLLSLLVGVASFTTDLWGIKYKHHASLLARGLKKKRMKAEITKYQSQGTPMASTSLIITLRNVGVHRWASWLDSRQFPLSYPRSPLPLKKLLTRHLIIQSSRQTLPTLHTSSPHRK